MAECFPLHDRALQRELWRYELRTRGSSPELRYQLLEAKAQAVRFGFAVEHNQLRWLELEMLLIEGDRETFFERLAGSREDATRESRDVEEYHALLLEQPFRALAGRKLDPVLSERLSRLQKRFEDSGSGPIDHWPFVQVIARETAQNIQLSQASLVTDTNRKVALPNSPTLRRFLERLLRAAPRVHELETLTRAVWDEPYDPRVHDLRIYQLARRLRAFFRANAIAPELLFSEPGRGYGLRVVPRRRASRADVLRAFAANLTPGSVLAPERLCKEFGYSARQAQRDLAWLVVKGFVSAHGAKRNRQYIAIALIADNGRRKA